VSKEPLCVAEIIEIARILLASMAGELYSRNWADLPARLIKAKEIDRLRVPTGTTWPPFGALPLLVIYGASNRR